MKGKSKTTKSKVNVVSGSCPTAADLNTWTVGFAEGFDFKLCSLSDLLTLESKLHGSKGLVDTIVRNRLSPIINKMSNGSNEGTMKALQPA